MLRILCAAALLFAAGCSTTYYTETDDEIRLSSGLGGFMRSKQKTYRAFAATGKKVVIDGQMISADAFFAFSTPGACYTENAVWSPHSISVLGLAPAYDRTEHYANRLPPKLRDWFKNHPSYYDWVGYPEVGYDELKRIWPEGACV